MADSQELLLSLAGATEEERRRKLRELKSPELLYIFSSHRTNLISWMPFKAKDSVLEVNVEYGELTEWLSSHVDSLFCVLKPDMKQDIVDERCHGKAVVLRSMRELDEERFSLARFDKIIFHVDNTLTVEEIKHQILYLTGRLQFQGILFLIMDNRLGLSKWIERDVQEVYITNHVVEARNQLDDRIGFSIEEMEKIIADDLKLKYRKFYPYPDQVFVKDIYTDQHLPKLGFNFGNKADFRKDRIQLMNQSDFTDVLVENGDLVRYFDSCIFAVTKEINSDIRSIDYVHFSDQRDEKFRSVTKVRNQLVTKEAYSNQAGPFIHSIYKNYQKLSNIYKDSPISYNKCVDIPGKGISLDFIDSVSLSEYVDSMLNQGEITQAVDLIQKVFQSIEKIQGLVDFRKSEEFIEVFGDYHQEFGKSLPVSNVDCIFDNIYIENGGGYQIADYEWTFDFLIPWDYIKARCIHYYLSYRGFRRELLGERLYQLLGIPSGWTEVYQKMEESFQRFVSGRDHLESEPEYQKTNYLLENIYHNAMGQKAWAERLSERRQKVQAEVNFDFGIGYYFENIKPVYPTKLEEFYKLHLTWPEGTRELRFDPASMPGVLSLVHIIDQNGKRVPFYSDGLRKIAKTLYLSPGNDPQIRISIKKDMKFIEVVYRYDLLITEREFIDIPKAEADILEEEQLTGIIQRYL